MLKYLYGKLPVANKLNGGREEHMGRGDDERTGPGV